MVNIKKYGEFEPLGFNKNKRQIVLCHTAREVKEYLTSLKFRYNGKYDKIPNYVIDKSGEILQLLPDDGYSVYLPSEKLNKNSIIISLENLGWLEKKPLKNEYINWKGSIYNGDVYEKKWRDYFFWQPYTEIQIESTLLLCEKLCDIMDIKKKCVGHNTKIDGAGEFEGIISRSNYDSRFTDLNPSFNFNKLIKKIENEKIH